MCNSQASADTLSPHHHGRANLGAAVVGTVLAVTLGCGSVFASSLDVHVDNGRGGVAEAVVSLHSAGAKAALQPRAAQMDQRGSEFVPRLMTVQTGSPVTFPNSDGIHHHVYSFSPAKRFELPLYSGEPSDPVHFESPGVVTLGCNIHDWMLGYIVVLDTPYSAITDASGAVRLQAPSGEYSLQVWHPHLAPGAPPMRRRVSIKDAGGSENVSLSLVPTVAPKREPVDPRLRALQDKLRSLKRER